MYNLVKYLVKNGKVTLDMEDEIIASALVTRDGKIIHAGTLEAMNLSWKVGRQMNVCLSIIFFIIATAVGYKVISDVPSLLHTPLMSGMNALSGVTVSGALIATAFALGSQNRFFGALAVILATINVIGGFLVTDRMLKMFK